MSWTGVPGTSMSRPTAPPPGPVPGMDARETCVQSMHALDDRENPRHSERERRIRRLGVASARSFASLRMTCPRVRLTLADNRNPSHFNSAPPDRLGIGYNALEGCVCEVVA